ncbi:MAG: DUF4189 domain-containing protein [Burkholderiales bacterium]
MNSFEPMSDFRYPPSLFMKASTGAMALQWGRQAGCVIALLLTVIAPVAQASFPFPCNGPGPGRRMIGMTPAGPNQPSIPLCVADAGAEAPAAPTRQQPRYSPTYFASVALHHDYDTPWMTGGELEGFDAAAAKALVQCRLDTRDMSGDGRPGSGCWTELSFRSGIAVVVRANDGSLYGGSGANHAQALEDARASCTKNRRQLLPCEEVNMLPSDHRRMIAPRNLPRSRKAYLGAAWVIGEELTDSLWVASGRANQQQALDDALAACQKARSGANCQVAVWGGNVAMVPVVMTDAKQRITYSVVTETTPERAAQAARLHCTKTQTECTLQATFNARDRWAFEHNFKDNSTRQIE